MDVSCGYKDYGYDCPYAANSLDKPHGTGDYIICRGVHKPILSTKRTVQNSIYKRLYTTKNNRRVSMFEVKDGGYAWNGKYYEKFRDVMRAMGDDVCEGNASVEFGDLTGLQLQGKALSQFLLFYAVAQLDVPALIQSVNADQYRKWTRMQGPVWIRRNNPLFARNFSIPMGYESNRTTHCAIWPALDSVYNRDTGFILTKRESSGMKLY